MVCRMAQKVETIVHLVDDIDGGKAARTIQFGLDGRSYEIDLSAKNAREMEKLFSRYTEAARPLRGAAKRKRREAAGPSHGAVRAWAQDNGVEVNAKGRVPGDVIEAYEQAH